MVKKEVEIESSSPFWSPKPGSTLKKKKRKRKHKKDDEPVGPPTQYKMIKLKTSIANTPIINSTSIFSQEEIWLAKKCKLNGWEKLPPELDPNFVEALVNPDGSPIK